MINARIRTATVASFLLGSPLTDPVIVVALIPLFDWKVAVIYPVTTSVSVFMIAIAADAVHLERHLRPVRSRALAKSARPVEPIEVLDSCDTACTSRNADPFTTTAPWDGWRIDGRSALRYHWARAGRRHRPDRVRRRRQHPELALLRRMMAPRLLLGYTTLAIVAVATITGYLIPT